MDNVFIKLNDIYLKKKRYSYEHDAYDRTILIAVTESLQQVKKNCPFLKGLARESNFYYHFAITMPTNWDDGIREDIIRPLYIQAGLIAKDDNHSRLLFFT